MQADVKTRAIQLLEEGQVDRVLGWKAGEFFYDLTPAVFTSPQQVEREFVWSSFSGPNLSKYLIAETRKPGKIAAFLKPCDTYSFQQLRKEHRLQADRVYVVAVQCPGMCDPDKVQAAAPGPISLREEGDGFLVQTLYGEKRLTRQAALEEGCLTCKTKKMAYFDELIGQDGQDGDGSRFDQVHRLEAMTPEERFAFWQGELSRCIRCNACRNVCPACSCEKCVFDNPASGVENKAAANGFEENLFHIIRAFHVAGRCTDCGECSRVCPQHIPLHLLNRKLIEDMNRLYGPYQAGGDLEAKAPLTDFRYDDPEPDGGGRRGGAQ